MDVCHKTGNGGEHTINIAAPAVPAHMAHGDSMGACAMNHDHGCRDDDFDHDYRYDDDQ